MEIILVIIGVFFIFKILKNIVKKAIYIVSLVLGYTSLKFIFNITGIHSVIVLSTILYGLRKILYEISIILKDIFKSTKKYKYGIYHKFIHLLISLNKVILIIISIGIMIKQSINSPLSSVSSLILIWCILVFVIKIIEWGKRKFI